MNAISAAGRTSTAPIGRVSVAHPSASPESASHRTRPSARYASAHTTTTRLSATNNPSLITEVLAITIGGNTAARIPPISDRTRSWVSWAIRIPTSTADTAPSSAPRSRAATTWDPNTR